MQRRAVDHEDGPLLIVAGAGTGKTRTLVSRLARLLEDGVAPERILLVTFSRRAAAEMIRRAGQIADPASARRVESGTFHSVAHRVLRRYRAALGLAEGFSVLDPGDVRDLIGLVRAPVAAGVGRRFPRTETVTAIYSRVVSSQVRLEDTVLRVFPWCADDVEGLGTIFSAYTERKRAQHLLDFEDLLLHWRAAVLDRDVGPVLAASFDHVLVDEYQDTSVVQADILRALRSRDARLTVVGDDAQAIYSFRAATVRNILDFPAHFPGATTVTLEQNYRSTASILDLANAVIAGAGEGYRKQLWTEDGAGVRPVLATCPDQQSQAEAVCQTILEHHESGTALKEQVVLFRTSHHSDLLEVELGRRNIPFVKFGGLKFLEAAHVKDLLAFLRWAENPRDRLSGFRVVQLLPGAGPATAAKVLDCIAGPADPAQALGEFKPPAAAAEHWASFVEAVRLVRGAAAGWPAELDLVRRWYEPHLHRIHDDAVLREADLLQLVQIAATYPSRERFLTELTLDPPDATSDRAGEPLLDEDYLILSTIHSAKGQEWKSVFVLNTVDGCLPSDLATGSSAEIEEERRLLYVAMTRAKDHLHLIVPQRFFVHGQRTNGDRHLYAARTRFIPAALLECFECRGWPPATVTDVSAKAARLQVDLKDRVRRTWG
jgi:DNA helicase II / ATP-dependent DNA helicase PcrA